MNAHEQTYLIIVVATFGLFALAVGIASLRETLSPHPEALRAPTSPRSKSQAAQTESHAVTA